MKTDAELLQDYVELYGQPSFLNVELKFENRLPADDAVDWSIRVNSSKAPVFVAGEIPGNAINIEQVVEGLLAGLQIEIKAWGYRRPSLRRSGGLRGRGRLLVAFAAEAH